MAYPRILFGQSHIHDMTLIFVGLQHGVQSHVKVPVGFTVYDLFQGLPIFWGRECV